MFEKFDKHSALMDGMATRAGAALDRALETGALQDWQYRDALISCTRCTGAADCAEHLQSGAEGIPGYCRNRRLFGRLAAEMQGL